ncbi:hypothetical protein PSPO01_12435 [Paraphaeosphaeria sporulosa]
MQRGGGSPLGGTAWGSRGRCATSAQCLLRAFVKRAGRPSQSPHSYPFAAPVATGPTAAAVTRSEGIVRGFDESEFRARFGLGGRPGKRDWLAVHCSRSRIRQQPHFFDTRERRAKQGGGEGRMAKEKQPAPAVRMLPVVFDSAAATAHPAAHPTDSVLNKTPPCQTIYMYRLKACSPRGCGKGVVRPTCGRWPAAERLQTWERCGRRGYEQLHSKMYDVLAMYEGVNNMPLSNMFLKPSQPVLPACDPIRSSSEQSFVLIAIAVALTNNLATPPLTGWLHLFLHMFNPKDTIKRVYVHVLSQHRSGSDPRQCVYLQFISSYRSHTKHK